MGGSVFADRAVLSQARQRPPAEGTGADVAHLFSAAMVQLSDLGVEEALYDSATMR
jgi:hypothetical protein